MAIPYAFWTLFTLTGCGLKAILPGKPVVNPTQLSAFDTPVPSPAVYTGESKSSFPVLPLAAFGLQYSADVVLVSQNPKWDMHEYARLDVSGQSIWIAKDSDQDGVQTIVADVPNLNTWMPEIPAPRIEAPVSLTDRSSGDAIDIEMAYTNPNGKHTAMRAKGTLPQKPPRKRNGNTMGHSRDVVAAVLDIERFGTQIKAGISIDGEEQKLDRILGLVPFKFLLRQTQAGVVVTNFRQTASDTGFTLTRPSPADPDWPTKATEDWQWDGQVATHDNGVARFHYRFTQGGLSEIEVQQHGLSEPTFQLQIRPALPDLSRPFDGQFTSRFVMHVNGQQGHGLGTITTEWSDSNTVALHFIPEAPFWLSDRPMKTIVRFSETDQVDVRTTRVTQ